MTPPPDEHVLECPEPDDCETCASLTAEEVEEIAEAIILDRLFWSPFPRDGEGNEIGGEA